jgi:hypothetical protein
MMVLFDFLLRRITPLQLRACSAWLYTGEGDAMLLERNHGSNLALDVLGTLLGRLSPDPSLVDFVTYLAVCAPMCSDPVTQMRLLKELPTLDDIGIAAW